MPAPPPNLDLTIAPPPAAWQTHVSGAPVPARASRFRTQLGLPPDGPLLLSGHQPGFWHMGIAAKYLACEVAARATGASPAWLVVDQADPDFLTVTYPGLRDGRLVRAAWSLALPEPDEPPYAPGSAVPAAHVPRVRVPSPPADPPPALPSVAGGMRSIAEAMHAHAQAPSAVRQVHGACEDLLAPLVGRVPACYASDLARTDLFQELLDRMRSDPRRCAETYNRAAAAHAGARLAPLRLPPDGRDTPVELPLWHLPPPLPHPRERRRVTTETLPTIPPHELAPRALLMTGLLRMGACQLFIHGTGGAGTGEEEGGYDRATDDWFESWLGERLAPFTLVTATVRLPFTGDTPSLERIRRSVWLAHHARHDPGALADEAGARVKHALLRQIEGARRTGADPAPIFARLHAELAAVRARHPDRLGALDAEAAELRARRAEARIAADRAWPFPLHAPETLRALHAAVVRRFALGNAAREEATA